MTERNMERELELIEVIARSAQEIARAVGTVITDEPDRLGAVSIIAAILYNIRFMAVGAVQRGDLVTSTQVFSYIKLAEESAGVQIKQNKDES